MRFLVVLFVIVPIMAVDANAQAADAIYVDGETVATAFAEGGSLAASENARVSVLRRRGPGQSEIHENETDVFYVVDGGGTFVTGGTMIEGSRTGPGQIRGTGIEGGVVHELVKGDVIVIPAGTPHWFSEVPQSINYFTVKAISN
jgi:mannose-6-phosphate isomerase-like protein (cupin superfamily)